MTITEVPSVVVDPPAEEPTGTVPLAPVDGPAPQAAMGGRQVALLAVLGLVVLVVAAGVVVYAVGPLIHDRDQRILISTERAAIARATRDNEGLYKAALPTQPPLAGSVAGILAIPAIGLQQAVVEGVGPSQTVSGPGHVPGTAGLGQPGNSAIVGRRAGYGGPFSRLADLRPGIKMVTATTEGQSVYLVRSVRTVTLVTQPPASFSAVTTTTLGRPTATTATGHKASGPAKSSKAGTTETFTALYGQDGHNQLTLVTSASGAPWNTDRAMVVVARMEGKPFPPTPQESRSPSQQGNSGDPSALPWLVLTLLALLATVAGAVALYRRSAIRTAYLLTTAPLLALTVLAAEAASRLLPAWL
jgi:sortase A